MSNFEPQPSQHVASLATYPSNEVNGFHAAWKTGMIVQMMMCSLGVARGVFFVVWDMADRSEVWDGLVAIMGAIVIVIGLVVALWNYAAMSVARSSPAGGAVMGAVAPIGAALLASSIGGTALAGAIAVLLAWLGVSAAFAAND